MDDEDQIGGTELAGLSELGGALSMGMYGTESGHKAAQGVLDSYMKKYGGEDADAPEKQFINQMKESSAQVQAALRKARERLIAQRYNPGELLLAASAGLGKPTRTGSIGETFSNLSEAMQGPLARKNQFERERDSDLLKLDTEEAQANQGVNAAELQLEMLNHRLAAGQATKALEVLNRPVRGTGAGGLRDRKIFDTWNILMRQGGMDPTAAYDRAVKLVDGKRRVIADPELGILRIVDDVEGTSEEVPLVDPATGKPAAKAPSTLPNASPAPLASATTPPAAAAGAPKPKPAPTVDTRDVTAP